VILDTLEQWWNALIDLMSHLVVPDWGALVNLLPIFVLIGVVGPILSLLVLAWFIYVVRRPRLKVAFAATRRLAALDEAGKPLYPAGEPYSPRERMIYEPGATRSESGEDLLVACPKCGLVRHAADDVCGNCGLSFQLTPTTRSIQRAGPPPGGAAAA
jgi:hypothetical protein